MLKQNCLQMSFPPTKSSSEFFATLHYGFIHSCQCTAMPNTIPKQSWQIPFPTSSILDEC